jgi:sulfite exporter TauE/SafE
LPIAELLPRSIGPYLTLMMIGFFVGIFGHLTRSKWLVAIGVILVFLAAFVFPLALKTTTDDPPPVLNYPPSWISHPGPG